MVATKSFYAALCALLPLGTLADTLVEQVEVPLGWKPSAQVAKADKLIRLQLALKEQNMDKLIKGLYDVSDPDSPLYGKHYQHDEVLDLIKPSKKHNDKVVSWLRSQDGVKHVESDGHWVDFLTTVGAANRFLSSDLKYYENENGATRLRTTQYSVPDSVADAVDLISPMTYFNAVKANMPSMPSPTLTKKDEEATQSAPDASCSTSITPQCIKELYSVGNYKPDPKSGSLIGFGSFLNESAIIDDLFKFEKLFNIPQQSFDIKTIHGGVDNQSAPLALIGEANLDIQNIIGVSHPLPVVEFITGGLAPFIENPDLPTPESDSNEPYLPYYRYLMRKPNSALPQVISNSYGDDEQTVPYKYANKVCNMIAAVGARGISILESSGDTGVGAPCVSNNKAKNPQFTPQFPGSCPFITAVGGTQSIIPAFPYEVAWTNGSGGFSNYFSRPLYQNDAVSTYFGSHVSKRAQKYQAPFFNRNGRGFPDISAHSLRPDYEVIYAGQQSPSGGTSAASPVVAGIIGLLNDARFREGKSALGFLNPFLYKKGFKALNDITEGGSVGCTGINAQLGTVLKGAKVIPFASWNATKGWDPVTGLGTPNFKKLKKMVLKMP